MIIHAGYRPRVQVRDGLSGDPATVVVATYDGAGYACAPVAGGAAYELFSDVEAPGFRPDRRPGARRPWHRYVHACELTAVTGGLPDPPDAPLTAPLSRGRGWSHVHRAANSAAHRDDPGVHAIRATGVVRRGTQMVKVLSPEQVSAYLRGRLPHGFCYRAYDVAHLRTPADLAVLSTDDGTDPGPAAFVLRWRAVDPVDYAVPMGGVLAGMAGLPPHGRVGAPVLGTGFTPSAQHLIPEFVTADLADVPLPANAQLVAYTADGDEILLYTFHPEQNGWARLAGPSHRHVLAGLPGVNPAQDYVPSGDGDASSWLVGTVDGREQAAVADPPDDFRVRALTRAARRPVQTLSRRWHAATWRGVRCVLLRRQDDWVRVRLAAPDAQALALLAVRCQERGVYEGWAPAAELVEHHVATVDYPL